MSSLANLDKNLKQKFTKHNFSETEILSVLKKSNYNQQKINYLFNSINSLKSTLKTRGSRDNSIIDSNYIKKFVMFFIDDAQFNRVYDKWKNLECCRHAKPSLDHRIPLYAGGGSEFSNLQFISTLENLAKNSIPESEWNKIKINIHNYFV